MKTQSYLDDIASIKDMMSRSSRFLSLSGLSGILAGCYALIGAFFAHRALYKGIKHRYAGNTITYTPDYTSNLSLQLSFIAVAVIIAAIITAIVLTTKKAKKNNEKIWDASSKRLLSAFVLPLVTGGLFCLAILQMGIVGLVAPATLLFYGLALVNASKYTLGDVKYLGIANIIIGLIATQFIGYGLYFWALGFGVFHIIYGVIMYRKYDSPPRPSPQRKGVKSPPQPSPKGRE